MVATRGWGYWSSDNSNATLPKKWRAHLRRDFRTLGPPVCKTGTSIRVAHFLIEESITECNPECRLLARDSMTTSFAAGVPAATIGGCVLWGKLGPIAGSSGRRGSNPRRQAWEACILPLNYSRDRPISALRPAGQAARGRVEGNHDFHPIATVRRKSFAAPIVTRHRATGNGPKRPNLW